MQHSYRDQAGQDEYAKRDANAFECPPGTAGRYDANRPIAFMHIPKTAGTWLRTEIQACTNTCGPAPGFDLSVFGDFAAFETVDPTLRSNVYFDGRLPQLDASFVTGHISASTLSTCRAGVQLITVLREPRSRLLSHWLFLRGLTDDQLRPWGKWGDYIRTARRPLTDFLSDRNVASHTDNLAVRMLLWPNPDIPGGAFISGSADVRLLDAARGRLQKLPSWTLWKIHSCPPTWRLGSPDHSATAG
jgi:hypothetical protein